MRSLLALLLIAGCSSEEFERIRARAEVNERIRLHCIPRGAETVISARNHEGALVCQRFATTGKGRQVEVVSRVVANAEEVQ